MRAVPEGGVARTFAMKIDDQRAVDLSIVQACETRRQTDQIAFAEIHALILMIVPYHPYAIGYSVAAYQLFDGDGHQRGVLTKLSPVLGMNRQEIHGK
jgi:hypothetical protein